MDNIFLIHETIHSLDITKNEGMILKLDLSKAFDKLSWEYMEKMLQAFGFHDEWIQWITTLTSMAFFSILVNGSLDSTFNPSRGIC